MEKKKNTSGHVLNSDSFATGLKFKDLLTVAVVMSEYISSSLRESNLLCMLSCNSSSFLTSVF